MIKDIVVNLVVGERDPAGDFAVSLAETFEAHVLGIALAYDPVLPGAVMGGVPPDFIDIQRNEANEKAGRAITRFEQAARRAGISFETRNLSVSVSGAADQLGQIARRFDIAVLGQPEPERATPDQVVGEAVLFESGRPVIFVPFIQRQGLKLDRMLICWDGSRAATRAIADSLPLLQRAKRIEVVVIGDKPPQSDEVAGADLGQHLARHGLTVDVKRITAPGLDVASTILSHAADTAADMIVMGGYGHSRLREFVLGGATRGMMESMTVPVLMSH